MVDLVLQPEFVLLSFLLPLLVVITCGTLVCVKVGLTVHIFELKIKVMNILFILR